MAARPLSPPVAAGDVAAANARFRESIAAIPFAFRCEDCAHFAPARRSCSLEFDPRFLLTQEIRLLADDGHLVFCKYFEMD